LAFTYDPTLADTVSKIRFEIGDKVDVGHLVEDEEITAVNARVADTPAAPTEKEILLAAADIADALAVQFARNVTRKNLSLSVSASDKSKQFKECARRLRQRAGISQAEDGTIAQSVEGYVGGLSIAEKTTDNEDTDLIQPSFRRGQDDHPGTNQDDFHAHINEE
jgi:hypothetical protein